MNWMGALLETYDSCIIDPSTKKDKVPLIPICHTLNNMHINIILDKESNFITADVISKDRQNTIIPCTEDSAGRTSNSIPHPLDDKLSYMVDDISRYTKEKIGPKYRDLHVQFMEQLSDWCGSELSNSKVVSVHKYLTKGTIVEDLLASGVLVADSDGILLSKEDSPDAPLFTIAKLTGEQKDAFVCWSVDDGGKCIDTWDDEALAKSWISYVKSKTNSGGLCYLTGTELSLAKNHPSRIRNSGDRSKIISSTDNEGLRYYGRFETPDQVYGLGFEVSQKIHSALRWLIARQGCNIGDLCIVAWTATRDRVINPVENNVYDFIRVEDDKAFTNVEAARHLNNRLRGYNSDILDKNVMIMVLDSAQSNKGKISIITFRRELGKDMVDRLEDWHNGCAWIHKYAKVTEEDGKSKKIIFIGAPSPRDLALAVYGMQTDDKIIAHTVKRLLPCIIDGEQIPRDIVNSIVRRASNPQAMNEWEWEKTLSIACSVYKRMTGGKYEMVLEKKRNSRDYLYGRLLAMADLMESSALKSAGENRQTTAIRLMQRFSEFPYATWKDIELALVPYASRLGPKANYYMTKISGIMDMFEGDDFRNNSKLSGEFLLAYHCQREDHYRKKDETIGDENDRDNE